MDINFELIEQVSSIDEERYSAKLYICDDRFIEISEFAHVTTFAKTCIFLEAFISTFLEHFDEDLGNGKRNKVAKMIESMYDNDDIVNYCKTTFDIDTTVHYMKLYFRELNMILVDYWDGNTDVSLLDVICERGVVTKRYKLNTTFELPKDFMETIIGFVNKENGDDEETDDED